MNPYQEIVNIREALRKFTGHDISVDVLAEIDNCQSALVSQIERDRGEIEAITRAIRDAAGDCQNGHAMWACLLMMIQVSEIEGEPLQTQTMRLAMARMLLQAKVQ